MPILGGKELWEKSDRWSAFGSEMFRVNDKTNQAFCLQPTHEEMVTKLVAEQGELRQAVYPLMLYQTGPKFRDEIAVGYGLLRSREFLMNDLYSFDITEKNAFDTYNSVNETYLRIFRDRLGINFYVVQADPGNIGGNLSHEYHLSSKIGRDSIAYCTKCNLATFLATSGVSYDLLKRGKKPCCCDEESISIIETVEIAHTFQLGDIFSKKLGAKHLGKPLIMNCFGIGIGRVVAALIDLMSPSVKALRLPYALAPFKVAVILPNKTQAKTMAFAEDLIGCLSQISTLQDDIFVDDRLDNSIGRRLLSASNLGIPHILVIGNRSARSLSGKPVVEYYRTEVHSDEPVSIGDLEYAETLFFAFSRMHYGFKLLLSANETRLSSVIKILSKGFHMEGLSSLLTISNKVRGITVLTDNVKKLFSKEITLPVVIVPPKIISRLVGCKEIASRTVGRFGNKIKPVINMAGESEKAIVFSPEKIDDNARSIVLKTIENVTGLTAKFGFYCVTINYDDWPVRPCIAAILPEGLEFGGFSQIGHIVHVNLRDELLPYKEVIGKILLDKITNCKTVVNKLDAIGHEYRTFELDLLAGEENYKTEVHEEKLRYQLDFSQVFYNPRLSTEHKRIIRKIGKRSIFYDCCAGIGPFVLPVVRNGAHHVLANDLNPNCLHYLKQNVELNHLSFERLKLYNLDAAVFIRTILADDLANKIPTDAHVVMNLPGMSLQFLPCFRGCLYNRCNASGTTLPFPLYVHCHFFVKAPDDLEDSWYFDEAQNLIRKSLGISDLNFIETRFVRSVAGRKKMFCATFQLSNEFLFCPDTQEPELKGKNGQELPETDSRNSVGERTCVDQRSDRPGIIGWLHLIGLSILTNLSHQYRFRFRTDRVMYFGPELACLEWLMECGSTEVIMSDGTSVTSKADMRRYISDFGFKFRSVPTITTPFKWSPVLPTVSMKKLDAIYDMRWAKKPNIWIVKVDATDSAIGDAGFQYFKECRQIEVLKLNFCDFFTDKAIEHLVSGRPSRTLRNIEIVANPYISDDFIKGIKRMRGLQRAHFYFLPCVVRQEGCLQSLKTSLPCCKVTFPELKEVGYGYDCIMEKSNVE
uniref:tRNA (guanine(37)-N1)-methyltransferase n=1 Tax=Setaria digitata TaxID=48799 RepID=A0A915PLH7_9BILA